MKRNPKTYDFFTDDFISTTRKNFNKRSIAQNKMFIT